MNHEEAFAEEAQEEAILSRNLSIDPEPSGKTTVHTDIQEEQDETHNETSPLIGPRQRKPYPRAGKSYERAIQEPWTGAHGAGQLPWYKKPTIFWLLPAFFPFCLAFGGVIVPKTYLVLDLICRDYLSDRAAKDPTFHFMPVMLGTDNPQCRDAHVQALVARFNLYSSLLSGVFSAIVAPHFGALSDRYGRKKIIVFATFGTFCMEIITIIVGSHPDTISIYWLLVGYLIDGLCGSFTTGMALAFAYAADSTPPERRNVAFGYFHATLFAGIALGPILAGYLMKLTGTVMIVFYVALGCHVFFIVFILLFVPESLSKERQMLAREKRSVLKAESPAESWLTFLKNYNLVEPLWVLMPTGEGSSPRLRKNLVVLAAIDTMMFGVAMGTMQILIIYAQYRYGWTAVDSSMFLSAVNVCRVSGLLIVLPLLTRVFRGPMQSLSSGHRGSDMLDIWIIRAAVVFDLVGYLGYALAPTGALMFASGIIASFGGIGSPTLASSLTKHIPSDRTGQMLGASGLLHALARVVAPTVFNLIYSLTVGAFAGTVFLCLGSVFVIVFILSWFIKPNVYFDEAIALQGQHSEDDE